MTKVLLLASDVIGERMAGPGIRSVELGRQLARAGNEVTVVGEGGEGLRDPDLRTLTHISLVELDRLARRQDAIVLQGFALANAPSLRSVAAPLVIDLYDPYPLALLDQFRHLPRRRQQADSRRRQRDFNQALRLGDFFICASQRQRDLWMGSLLAAGRVNPATWGSDPGLERLLAVVPFGLPEEPPERHGPGLRAAFPAIADADPVLLWGGGLYNWFDAPTLIRALAVAVAKVPELRLVFMSMGHPNAAIPPQMWMPQRAEQLARELGLLEHNVFFNRSWIPYSERPDWLLQASAGVSTHYDRVETRYSFRTRLLDYLWAGLPMVVTDGDGFADLVRERQLGWVVAAEDVAGLAQALVELASDRDRREKIAERVRAAAKEFRWSVAARELVAFCGKPWMAADRPRRGRILLGAPPSAAVHSVSAFRLARAGLSSLVGDGPGETLRRIRARRRRTRGRGRD